MHAIKASTDQWILKIPKGELVHASLHEFCNQHEIINAYFSGIGAVGWVRCGYYDLPNKKYLFSEHEQIVEVASYSGNIMRKEDSIFVHAHGVFSDVANQTFGGHVDEMRVGVTMEIIVTPLSTSLERTFDPDTGLYLIDISNT